MHVCWFLLQTTLNIKDAPMMAMGMPMGMGAAPAAEEVSVCV